MGAATGYTPLGDYSAATTIEAKIAILTGLIPDPDTAPSQQGGGGFLDEMSPVAAAHLRAEIEAFAADLEADDQLSAFGSYVAIAGDDTANLATIDTGLDTDAALGQLVVDIKRGGSRIGVDAVVTDLGDGTFTVADGAATYDVTAGDVIAWAAAV